jgi:hypothetical protein
MNNPMQTLKTLEALFVAEVSAKRGEEVSTLDPSVVGSTIGTLYGVILTNPKALKQLEEIVLLKAKKLKG